MKALHTLGDEEEEEEEEEEEKHEAEKVAEQNSPIDVPEVAADAP